MNRFYVAAVSAAALAPGACATVPGAEPNSDKVLVTTPTGPIHTDRDVKIVSANFKSARSVVVPILKEAYEEVGIPVKVADPVNGQVGNNYFVKNARLGSVPLSKYLSCGNTLMGATADNYKITLSVLSIVAPNSGGSRVQTHVTARADGPTGGGSLQCESNGLLEDELYRILLRRLGDREL
jgi:hypothetical protein